MRSYKVVAEITVHNVNSAGTWLPNRDDVYLTVEAFGQVKRTRLSDPVFPLYFHERFTFEKMFWSALDPVEVTEFMEDSPVVLELRQVTDVYLGGTLLAYFDTNSRDYFGPSPCLSPQLLSNRELVMTRTVDFPGISPRLEFSSYTVISECPPCSSSSAVDGDYLGDTMRSSRSKTSARAGSTSARTKSYETSGKVRSKSPSASIDYRTPFVVRKVDDGLLSRKPGYYSKPGLRSASPPPRARSVSPTRLRGEKRKGKSGADDGDDAEVEAVLSRSARTTRSRPTSPLRSTSPALRPASAGAAVGDSYTERVKRRVDEALWRSRLLRYPYYPHSHYPYNHWWRYPYNYRYPYYSSYYSSLYPYYYGYPYDRCYPTSRVDCPPCRDLGISTTLHKYPTYSKSLMDLDTELLLARARRYYS